MKFSNQFKEQVGRNPYQIQATSRILINLIIIPIGPNEAVNVSQFHDINSAICSLKLK